MGLDEFINRFVVRNMSERQRQLLQEFAAEEASSGPSGSDRSGWLNRWTELVTSVVDFLRRSFFKG